MIKNVCAIPVKWKLEGVDELPVEFSVVNIFGELKPIRDCNRSKFQRAKANEIHIKINIRSRGCWKPWDCPKLSK